MTQGISVSLETATIPHAQLPCWSLAPTFSSHAPTHHALLARH